MDRMFHTEILSERNPICGLWKSGVADPLNREQLRDRTDRHLQRPPGERAPAVYLIAAMLSAKAPLAEVFTVIS